MTVIPLLLLLLPVLCLAHSTHYRSPPPSCPEHICVCSVGEGPTAKRQQREANCKEMPTARLTKTITTLRVSGQITKITQKMIATLGGDLLTLDLSECEIQNIEPGSFGGAPKLTKLKLSNNQIEEIGPGMFKKNKMLRELYLDGNKLKHIDESAFSKLEQLRELHLERNYLTQFPSKIPIGLTMLNVSQNNLGPDLVCEIHETNLKELNLCGNHLEKVANTTLHAFSQLQKLCLGDQAFHFPKNTATCLPHLSDLSLIASTDSNAILDPTTQEELAGMETLTSLTIVNYKLGSVSFLHSLTNLRHLVLKSITTPDVINFQSILLSHTSLTVLNLEDSHSLAQKLLDKMQVLGTLNALQTIILRNTGITHLASFDVPHTDRVLLDISKNPLYCDCRFAWLKNKEQSMGMQHFLLSPDDTICAAPSEFVGQKLMEVVNNLDCSSQDNRDNRDSFSPYKPHTQIKQNPSISDESEQSAGIDNGDGALNQHDKSDLQQHTDQGSESEFPTHPDLENESGFPTNPHQTEDDVTTEPMITSQAGDSDVEDNKPEGTSHDFEDQGEMEIEHSTSPITESTHNTPEYMPVHDNYTDNYRIVYIVLGTLLGLLILVGLILAIFYWHFKKSGINKITPAPGMTTTSDGTPVEPTYQQLQHTEGSSLIKNLKK